MWDMPEIKVLHPDTESADFDQCRWGCETTKPTRFLSYGLNFSSLDKVRCNHSKTQQSRPDGSTYWAAHPNPVQRWRTSPTGDRERASRAPQKYSTDLCAVIAFAIHNTQRQAGWLAKELDGEEL